MCVFVCVCVCVRVRVCVCLFVFKRIEAAFCTAKIFRFIYLSWNLDISTIYFSALNHVMPLLHFSCVYY